jgi:hypothetical protein
MVQVKTSRSGRHGWVMSEKNERDPYRDERLFYALVDFEPEVPVVYIVPSSVVADTLTADHGAFLARGGRDNRVRRLRPSFPSAGWLDQYREAWSLLGVMAPDAPA